MLRASVVCLTILALAGLTPVLAGDDQPASAGILPVPDYSGDIWDRPFLSGNWGGLRQDLAGKGLFFDLEWFNAYQHITDGGSDEGGEYGTNLDLYVNLDLMRMNVLPGALVSFRAQSRFGESVNGNSGVLLPVNLYSYGPFSAELDDDVGIAITELNYLQFLSEEFAVILGKVTTMGTKNEFSGGAGRSQFMNFQLQMSSVTALVAPYSTLAAGLIWMPSPNITVTNMFFNTLDSTTTTGFGDIGDGTTWSLAVDTKFDWGGLPGGWSFGGLWAFDNDFEEIGGLFIDPGKGVSAKTKRSAWSLSLSGWQYLIVEDHDHGPVDPANGRQDLEGVGLFLLLGLGDNDTNPVAWSAAGGVSGRGTLPWRPDDTWGIGYFRNNMQDKDTVIFNSLHASTQGVEAYYSIALASSVALTLDFQWAKSAIRDVDDAIILGARLNISF